MNEDLTHYDVLGVEPTATKESIREAYQGRLAEVQADITREQGAKRPDQSSIEGYRREEARIRNAWQVLSDPYQRGRYDAAIEADVTDGGGEPVETASGDEVEVVDESGNGDQSQRGARARGGRARGERPPGLFSADPLPTPPSWPSGYRPPPPRARVLAMFVDMVVLGVAFFAGFLGVAPVVLDEMYPRETTQLDVVNECQDRLLVEQDRENRSAQQIREDEAFCEDQADVNLAPEQRRENRNLENRLEDDLERADERASDLRGDMSWGQFAVQFGILAVLLLYLVPPSARTGQTLGKRLFQIRVVHIDGSRLNTRTAIVRYGAVVLAAMFLGSLLPPLGFALVLFGVLAWPRNPNLQGLHDRLAKTIVVDG